MARVILVLLGGCLLLVVWFFETSPEVVSRDVRVAGEVRVAAQD